jgi:hypothetical protein
MAHSRLIKSQRDVYEGTTPAFEATLINHRDEAILLTELSSLTLKLFVKGGPQDGQIVNDRDDQDVLNDNNVEVEPVTGLMRWTIQDEDVATLDTTLEDDEIEEHRALFRYELTNGHKGIRILDLRCHKVEGI